MGAWKFGSEISVPIKLFPQLVESIIIFLFPCIHSFAVLQHCKPIMHSRHEMALVEEVQSSTKMGNVSVYMKSNSKLAAAENTNYIPSSMMVRVIDRSRFILKMYFLSSYPIPTCSQARRILYNTLSYLLGWSKHALLALISQFQFNSPVLHMKSYFNVII